MTNFKAAVKKYFTFKEPSPTEHFILSDNPDESGAPLNSKVASKEKHEMPVVPDKKISSNLYENMEYLKSRFSMSLNSDVTLREFDITIKNCSYHAFIVFYDGMIDTNIVNNAMLQPLMLLSNLRIEDDTKDILSYIKAHLLPHNQLKEVVDFNLLIKAVNYGSVALFIDTLSIAFVLDAKGFEFRAVGKPDNEIIIRGPQEGFTETLRVNTSLIRKRLKDENLLIENLEVGERSKTLCAVLYVKNIANDSLVEEVKRRITSVKIDYLNDSGQLEQLIEDNSLFPVPQVSATERPDRCSIALSEGRVVIIVDGSPFALILPVVFYDLIRASEDYYIRFPYVSLLRYIRITGILFSLLLPGIYIAITAYHQEMIPTSLLLAIASSREKVPFPSLFEILLMEISFELIREAGVRIPGPLGPTIGIIGALILGQAAVAANIVSPILIIIVAVTGIGSFAIVDYSLAFAIRYIRFIYIFLGAVAGFLGLSAGVFIQGLILVSAKSFGVPMFAPYGPRTAKKNIDSIFPPPIWKRENRPDFLNPKDSKRMAKISRGWTKQSNKGEKNE